MKTIVDPTQDTLDAFVVVDTPALPVVDRSSLEAYALCPARARYVETGAVQNSSLIGAAGEEVHKALGNALCDYVAEQGILTKGNLYGRAEAWLLAARPDVQPEAVRAFRRALWPWAELISGIAYQNLLHFDGGQGRRGGQLAADWGTTVRLTSEIDLLYAGPSKAVLHEIDYKSGWKFHTERDVYDSFQFGLHAFLVFQNYKDVEQLEVRVWNTRSNALTYGVQFNRADCTIQHIPQERGGDRVEVGRVYARIHTAVGVWLQQRGMKPERAEAWPAVEKCPICPAAIVCPLAGAEIRDLAADPGAFVDQMLALDARLAAMRKLASGYVDRHGDIVSDASGAAFGIDKPKSSRKTPKGLYKIKGETTENEASE